MDADAQTRVNLPYFRPACSLFRGMHLFRISSSVVIAGSINRRSTRAVLFRRGSIRSDHAVSCAQPYSDSFVLNGPWFLRYTIGNVIHRMLSTVFSLLLLGSVLLGQCATCRSPQPQAPSHSCCQKHKAPAKDHCGQPFSQPESGICVQLGQGLNYEKPDQYAGPALQLMAALAVASPETPVLAAHSGPPGTSPLLYSPPELFILNSTFLI